MGFINILLEKSRPQLPIGLFQLTAPSIGASMKPSGRSEIEEAELCFIPSCPPLPPTDPFTIQILQILTLLTTPEGWRIRSNSVSLSLSEGRWRLCPYPQPQSYPLITPRFPFNSRSYYFPSVIASKYLLFSKDCAKHFTNTSHSKSSQCCSSGNMSCYHPYL